MESRADAGGGCGDYNASLLNSSPRLDFGVLGGMPVLDNVMAATAGRGGDCLEKFCGDPGFVERVTQLSSFNGQRFAWAAGLFRMPPLAPIASNGEFGGGGGSSREASSVSDPASVMKDANAKKRKEPTAKGKGKEPSLTISCQKELDAKRCKTEEGEKKESPVKPKAEQAGSDGSIEDGRQKQAKGKNAKPVEPPKDYVHVRARRGKATDSHIRAERVRRERISQRMKVLQDLVP